MPSRLLALGAALLAVPAAVAAQPNRYELETQVAPGQRAMLRIGTVPAGGFAFSHSRVPGDGAKRFTLTQQRNGAGAVTVLRVPGPQAAACQGAAGSLICDEIATPAVPANRTWTFRFTNQRAPVRWVWC